MILNRNHALIQDHEEEVTVRADNAKDEQAKVQGMEPTRPALSQVLRFEAEVRMVQVGFTCSGVRLLLDSRRSLGTYRS